MPTPKIQESSITKKLTRMNMLVSGAALLIACAAFIGFDIVSFGNAIVYNLSTQAQVLGSNSISSLVFNDPRSAETTLSALHSSPDVVFAAIYTPDGKTFAAFRRDPSELVIAPPPIAAGQTEAHLFQGANVVLIQSIVFQGKQVGAISIQSGLRRLIARIKLYLLIASLVFGVSLVLAFMVSSAFRRSVAKPIVHVAEIARTVSRDRNYSVRATPSAAHDELSILIEAFNEMLTQIQDRDAALQAARSDLERRVQERTAELAAANKELEAFSYSVSHDLRSPLRSMDGFSKILLDDYTDKLDAEGKDCLRRVRSSTQRMSQLIDDLLNLSKVTRASMQWETVDLTALAKSVAEEIRNQNPARQVEFVIAEGLTGQADLRLLRVVMENLFGNAWKYTSTHDRARIEFGRTSHEGGTAYFVRDDGAGFDPRYSERLFGAFQRLHKETEFPGTGIGLATVQRIIHRHGGNVWAESAVGKGATFYFTLTMESHNGT